MLITEYYNALFFLPRIRARKKVCKKINKEDSYFVLRDPARTNFTLRVSLFLFVRKLKRFYEDHETICKSGFDGVPTEVE